MRTTKERVREAREELQLARCDLEVLAPSRSNMFNAMKRLAAVDRMLKHIERTEPEMVTVRGGVAHLPPGKPASECKWEDEERKK